MTRRKFALILAVLVLIFAAVVRWLESTVRNLP